MKLRACISLLNSHVRVFHFDSPYRVEEIAASSPPVQWPEFLPAHHKVHLLEPLAGAATLIGLMAGRLCD